MKLKFRRSGGFANINTEVELDSTTMEPKAVDSLQTILAKVLPLKSPEKPSNGADLHTYDLQIDDNGEAQTLSVNDADASEDMHDLFDFLLQQR